MKNLFHYLLLTMSPLIITLGCIDWLQPPSPSLKLESVPSVTFGPCPIVAPTTVFGWFNLSLNGIPSGISIWCHLFSKFHVSWQCHRLGPTFIGIYSITVWITSYLCLSSNNVFPLIWYRYLDSTSDIHILQGKLLSVIVILHCHLPAILLLSSTLICLTTANSGATFSPSLWR